MWAMTASAKLIHRTSVPFLISGNRHRAGFCSSAFKHNWVVIKWCPGLGWHQWQEKREGWGKQSGIAEALIHKKTQPPQPITSLTRPQQHISTPAWFARLLHFKQAASWETLTSKSTGNSSMNTSVKKWFLGGEHTEIQELSDFSLASKNTTCWIKHSFCPCWAIMEEVLNYSSNFWHGIVLLSQYNLVLVQVRRDKKKGGILHGSEQ